MNTRKSTSSMSWFETGTKMWRVPTWIYFTFSPLRILSVTDDQRCIQTRVVHTKLDIYVCILNVVKFLSVDMVHRSIWYKSNTTDATSGARIFMLSVKHMLLNILIQWKFATLAKLFKFKTMFVFTTGGISPLLWSFEYLHRIYKCVCQLLTQYQRYVLWNNR